MFLLKQCRIAHHTGFTSPFPSLKCTTDLKSLHRLTASPTPLRPALNIHGPPSDESPLTPGAAAELFTLLRPALQ